MTLHELENKLTSYTASQHTACNMAVRQLYASKFDMESVKPILRVDADKIRTFDKELYDWINS